MWAKAVNARWPDVSGRRRVAVTGLGLVSSQGTSPHLAFDAWCQGHSGIREHDIGEGEHTVRVPYALCQDFDAVGILGRTRLPSMDRVSQLGTAAAQYAWQDAGLEACPQDAREEMGVCWGTGGGGAQTVERSYRDLFLRGRSRISPLSVVLGMNNAAASHVALRLGLGGECLTYSVACASSAVAVGEAFRRIRAGEAPIMVAGGAEAGLPYGMVKAWESLQVLAPAHNDAAGACQPFARDRRGLVLGEGAAALVLEDLEHARARGARIYAELLGYGGSCDHAHLSAPDEAGQVRALRKALGDAQLRPADVQYVNAHGTATPEGDPVEVQALRTVFGEAALSLMVSATKSMHGHLLGAAGAIEALITTLALHRQEVPPTASAAPLDPACEGVIHVRGQGLAHAGLKVALSNSFAFGGSNAVLVFGAWRD